MGCIFSICKGREVNQPILGNNIYCNKCRMYYSYNQYNKHIVKCTSIDFIK